MLRAELSQMLRGPKRFWIGTTLLAIGAAELLFFSEYPGLIYDAYGYYVLAHRIVQGGLFAAAYPVRTYGYPLFVAACGGFARVGPDTARVLVFHVQLALLILCAAVCARLLGYLQRSDAHVRIAYAAVLWSPFLLARATEALSDLLAGVLGYLAVALAWKRDHPARQQSPPAAAAASLFLAASAAVVRPSAAGLFAAVVALWIARQWIWREFRPAVLPLLLVVAILPFVPQMAINKHAYGRIGPLPVKELYREQMNLGMSRLKYATSVRRGEEPEINYLNPLYRAEKTPREFLLRRPLAYAATCAIHLFAMLDQDFLFADVREFHPVYRWPLSAANFLFLFIGGIGAAVWLRQRGKPLRRDPRRFAAVALLVSAGASAMIYLPAAVESRFAAPIELLWTPFFATALVAARSWWSEKRWRLLAAVGTGGLLFILLCLRVSAWITAQAPKLR